MNNLSQAISTTNDGYRKHRNRNRTKDPLERLQEGGLRWLCERNERISLDSEVILVFSTAALGYPKYDRGEHQPDILRDVAVTVVLVHLGVVVQNVLEDQDALVGGKGGNTR